MTHPDRAAAAAMTEAPDRPAFARWLASTNAITQQFLALSGDSGIIGLAGGLPPPEAFAVSEIAGMARAAVERHGAAALGYGAIEGLAPLRDAIAARHSTPRVRLGRENVLIISGSMQGLDLVGKALIDPGDAIVGHDPTYLGALDAWRPRGPVYRPLGLDPDAPAPFPAFGGAKFVYAVPNYSNPTGVLVDAAMRGKLLAAALAANTWLVEDDPYGALRYDGPRLPSLLEMSGDGGPYRGPVIHLGTLSKTVSPGLRVGWMIAAPEMIAALAFAKQGSDLCTGGVQQAIALEAIESGLIERRLPALLDLYRARRDALCDAMAEHLAPWFEWRKPSGGMFVWARARDRGLDTDSLLQKALARGVSFCPSSVFDASGAMRDALRLNFTYNPPGTLREGVRRLALAVAEATGERA